MTHKLRKLIEDDDEPYISPMEIMQSKPSADSGICLSVPYQSQSLSEDERGQEEAGPPGSPGLTMGGLPEINIMAELETMRVRLGRRKSISRDNIDEIGQFLSQTAGLGERTKSTENLPNHLVHNLENEARKSLSDSIESLQVRFLLVNFDSFWPHLTVFDPGFRICSKRVKLE